MTNQVGFNRTDFVWPYCTSYGTITHVDSDVLVVGGGLAGSCAAIAAARRGARVAVADKGAAEYAAGKRPGKIDREAIQAEAAKNYAPIVRFQKGDDQAFVSWKELWAGSTRAMQQCCAEYKTPVVLEQGLRWISSLRANEAQHTFARNPHELARVLNATRG